MTKSIVRIGSRGKGRSRVGEPSRQMDVELLGLNSRVAMIQALVPLEHPDFRAELLHAAKRRRIVYSNQIIPLNMRRRSPWTAVRRSSSGR